MKKVAFVICVSVICVVLVALVPKANGVKNAVVNLDNGDIAFSYTGEDSYTKIALFDKDGNKIFVKSIYFGDGGTYMRFKDDILCVCIGRQDKMYFINRGGTLVDPVMTKSEIKGDQCFENWESSFGKKEFCWGSYVYKYKSPTLFQRCAELMISNNGNNKTIYFDS